VYYTDWSPESTPEGKRDRARAADHEVSFKKATRAGLRIVFGTDIGGIPWSDPIAPEFNLMTKFGMTPMDAIRSATIRPAEMLDMQGEIGVIAPGAYADIIAVRGNPLVDIGELGRVSFVMKSGQVFSHDGGAANAPATSH
jgi:imidazolonepropionase-like amidohydrolase